MTAYYIPHSPTLNDSLSLIDPLPGDPQSDYLARFSHAAHLGGPSSAPRFDFGDASELDLSVAGHYSHHHHHVHDAAAAHMYLPTSMLVGSMSPLDNPFQQAAAAAASTSSSSANASTSTSNIINPTSLSQQQPFLEAAAAHFDPALSYSQPWNAYEELDQLHHHHAGQDAPPDQPADDEMVYAIIQQPEAVIPNSKPSTSRPGKKSNKSKKPSSSTTLSSKKTVAPSRSPLDSDHRQSSNPSTATTTGKKAKKLTKKQIKDQQEQEQQQQLYLLHLQQQQYNQEPINSTETSPDSSSLNHLLGDSNVTLPVLSDTEPLFVNAKQYHRIIKRRNARARLQELHRLSTSRKVSLIAVFHSLYSFY